MSTVTGAVTPALAVRRPGRVTQLNVLRSEWTKFTTLRSTLWTTAIAVATFVGLGALFAGLAVGESAPLSLGTTAISVSPVACSSPSSRSASWAR